MRKTTNKKKAAPILITVAVVLFLTPLAILLIAVLRETVRWSVLVSFFLLAYLVVIGGTIGGALKALLQRLDEIDGGEEEEASQY